MRGEKSDEEKIGQQRRNQRSGKVWTTGEMRGKIREVEDAVRSQGQPQGQLSE